MPRRRRGVVVDRQADQHHPDHPIGSTGLRTAHSRARNAPSECPTSTSGASARSGQGARPNPADRQRRRASRRRHLGGDPLPGRGGIRRVARQYLVLRRTAATSWCSRPRYLSWPVKWVIRQYGMPFCKPYPANLPRTKRSRSSARVVSTGVSSANNVQATHACAHHSSPSSISGNSISSSCWERVPGDQLPLACSKAAVSCPSVMSPSRRLTS